MSIIFKDQIIKGVLNYPILYIPHFHRKYIIEEVKDVCRKLYNSEIIRYIDCSYKDILPESEEKKENKKKKSEKYDYNGKIVEKLAQYFRNLEQFDDPERAPYVCVVCEANRKLLNDAGFNALLHTHVQSYENKGIKENKENKENTEFKRHTLILCVPSGELPPPSISGICAVLTIKPPTEEDIRHELSEYGLKGDTTDIETEYVRALQGLHLFDVRQILCSTKNTYGNTLFPTAVKWAYAEKQELIRKTGVLEVVEPDVSLSDIGGLGNLKPDIESAARLYKNISVLRKANVPIPKGYLLLGMPGCGKSMIAKATATEFGCPLLKLDMGKLLGKYVGDSEHNLQIALDVVDSAHPCVLWIDEIEKAFAGTNNVSGEGDSVMMRLMGKFLTWMQERKTAVFIMATANDVLKPELMRKGRFDEVYFVDFPTEKEAEEIIGKTVEKYSNIGDGSVPFGLFTQEYIREIAKKMTESKVDDVHCLSGAEIKSLIDSTVAKKISELIKNANDKKAVDLNNLSISKDYLEEQLNTAKASAMINQKSPKNQKGTSVAKMSFIDKIYEFKEKYHFKPASI